MIYNDKYKHVVFVDFVNAIHNYNFEIFTQNFFTKFVDKKQFANSFVNFI